MSTEQNYEIYASNVQLNVTPRVWQTEHILKSTRCCGEEAIFFAIEVFESVYVAGVR